MEPISTITAIVGLLNALQQMQPVQPNASTPRQVEQHGPVEMPRSLAEIGDAVLKCYHPTARFKSVDVAEHPWNRGHQYNASESALLRIDWQNVIHNEHTSYIALVQRGDQLRSVIQSETTVVPASRHCQFDQWTTIR